MDERSDRSDGPPSDRKRALSDGSGDGSGDDLALPLFVGALSSKRSKSDRAIARAWRGGPPLAAAAPPARAAAAAAAAPPRRPIPPPSGPDTAPSSLHVSRLPRGATAALLRQFCAEISGGDEGAVVDVRLVEKPERPPFAFVEARDAPTSRRLLGALDGARWLGATLDANFARPRRTPGDPKPRVGLDYEVLAAHVDAENRRRADARAAARREERAAWEKEHGPRVAAEKAAARAAGHFGHGLGRDGRPKLHSGYRDML